MGMNETHVSSVEQYRPGFPHGSWVPKASRENKRYGTSDFQTSVDTHSHQRLTGQSEPNQGENQGGRGERNGFYFLMSKAGKYHSVWFSPIYYEGRAR